MKKLAHSLVGAAVLVAATLLGSCAAPLVVGAVGGLVGVWVYDDFSDDRGEILLAKSPEQVFAAAEAVVGAREAVEDLKLVRGSFRIEFKDGADRVEYRIIVLIVPGSPDYSTLRVYAAERGLRGRSDLAKALADEIAARG